MRNGTRQEIHTHAEVGKCQADCRCGLWAALATHTRGLSRSCQAHQCLRHAMNLIVGHFREQWQG